MFEVFLHERVRAARGRHLNSAHARPRTRCAAATMAKPVCPRDTSGMSSLASLSVAPTAHGFAAVVDGVDLRGPLDASLRARLVDLWKDHPLLCFPEQALDPAAL